MNYLVLLIAYIIGSIPFGYLIARVIIKTDIRHHGSGNIGATNILRVVGWKAALPVFLLDMLKGFIAVFIAKAVTNQPEIYLTAGILAMIGHSFPIFLNFKGGKAAATGIGVLAALSVTVLLILAACAFITVALTRYVSLGSMVGAALVPVLFWIFGFEPVYILFGIFVALLVIWRHKTNIERLLKGTESKLGQKA